MRERRQEPCQRAEKIALAFAVPVRPEAGTKVDEIGTLSVMVSVAWCG